MRARRSCCDNYYCNTCCNTVITVVCVMVCHARRISAGIARQDMWSHPSKNARLFTARGVSRSSQTDNASAQTACTQHSRERGQTDRDRLVGERGRAEGQRSTRRTCNAGPHDARVALPPLRHADAPSGARLLLPLAGAATEGEETSGGGNLRSTPTATGQGTPHRGTHRGKP